MLWTTRVPEAGRDQRRLAGVALSGDQTKRPIESDHDHRRRVAMHGGSSLIFAGHLIAR